MHNLSSISGFYLYAGPAPNGYGTPAPKVAETVLRARKYNLKKEDKRERKLSDYLVNDAMWLKEHGPFPFYETAGNWHPGQAHAMYKKFLLENHSSIISVANEVMTDANTTNSDILTQGKQTWCPIKQKSLPSSNAYQNMADFFRSN